MKFSIFIEMQISQPNRVTERQLFHDCVEQAVLADALGYHCVWAVEHHGLYEYAHSSAPEVYLAFVAARTRRIRLGHGVTLTPGRYNHPIRIAERVAALDVLSEGRVNWGSGKSASRVEQDAFQVDRTQLDRQWLEALEMIPRIWRSEVFEWNSALYQIPPTQVVPKPVQRPHPPLYAACSSAENAQRLGELGVGALNFAQGTDDFLVKKVQAYRDAIAAASPKAYQVNNHFACTPTALVLENDHEACVHGFRGARFFGQGLARYYFTDERPLGPLDVPRDDLTEAELEAAKASRSRSGGPLLAVIGDPAAARESVQRFQDAGVDELILIMQMGTVPHELILRSLRVFAEQVMPHFA
ncbi:LLM class flavin-dependent oxidoreductase [Aquabacterium sp. A7-Y]|uniref:LLM class flavin-dependent oxidoreductase n=1 Tax=Aquabacterium sp. A7-Y TaxID=1349605 RepID=UPI00223E03D5|nr:LLM class flavin-dependent oxidoreductase [Aquabacterium sp. A7-Y]MCW7540232.1 LLM class flavin-dependent oxidoreductase [Aquabacterium sp. A7-Y]